MEKSNQRKCDGDVFVHESDSRNSKWWYPKTPEAHINQDKVENPKKFTSYHRGENIDGNSNSHQSVKKNLRKNKKVVISKHMMNARTAKRQ